MSRSRQSRRAVETLSYDYPSGHRIAPHRHRRHQLVHASAGVMTVQTPHGSWVVPPQRAVWIPSQIIHSIEISGRVSMRTLYLAPQPTRTLPVDCCVLGVSPLLRELILRAVALGGLDRRVPAEAHLLAVILDQLETLPTPAVALPPLRDPRAARLAARLRRTPGDRRPLGRLLSGIGASERTIERLFRSETGLSFGRWRQQLRLQHALRLLATGQSVTSVALEVGYESLSAFVSAFRRVLGTTPGRFFRTPDHSVSR
jgi:AraC-like DNA-binding protein